MELNTLKPAFGAVKSSKRVGRGQGSGKGGTATRGHKGAKSRSGYKRKLGFEGGQLPLQRRIPRYGFKNPNRVAYRPISLAMLQALSEKANVTVIDATVLQQHGLVNKRDQYKILGNGELTAKLEVMANAFSAAAKEAIVAQGGQATVLDKHA